MRNNDETWQQGDHNPDSLPSLPKARPLNGNDLSASLTRLLRRARLLPRGAEALCMLV